MTQEELKQWTEKLIFEQIGIKEEQIIQSLLNDNVFDSLKNEIETAFHIYSNHEEVKTIDPTYWLFYSTLNDCLLAEKGFIASPLW